MTLSVILVLAGKLIFSSDLSVLDKASDALSKKDLGFMRYILISQDISLLIIPSIIIMLLMRPESSGGLTELKMPQLKEMGLVVILTFCIFLLQVLPVKLIQLCIFLAGFQEWNTG